MKTHFLRWLYTFSLFDDYFKMVRQINAGNGSSARRRVLLIQAFFFSFTLFLVTVALVSDQLPILVQLTLNNFFFFEGIPMGHLVWIITVIYLMMYLNDLLYLRNDGLTFAVLYSIIASTDSSGIDHFFLQSQKQLFRGRLLPFGRLFVRTNNLNTSTYPAILLPKSINRQFFF